jgi:hypothetical protein
MATKTIQARSSGELILKIRKVEGWPRVEGDTVHVIRRAKEIYDIELRRDGQYVATRKKDM